MRYLLSAGLIGLLVVGVVMAACGGGDGLEGESRGEGQPTGNASAGGGGPGAAETASVTAGEEATRAAVSSSEASTSARTDASGGGSASGRDVGTGGAVAASEGDGGEASARVVKEEESDYEIHNIIARDRIPAILDPEFLDSSAAMEAYNEHEQVLGLSINGDHRAYPLPFLSQHEIVNDVVGGKPVAVTW